jgi:hypothetical protein
LGKLEKIFFLEGRLGKKNKFHENKNEKNARVIALSVINDWSNVDHEHKRVIDKIAALL